MELILLSLSASFAVLLPNGSVGVIRTFVNRVTRNNAMVITCQENPEINWTNALAKRNVHLRFSTRQMVKSMHLDVVFAGTCLRIRRTSDRVSKTIIKK
jgi:hypothetical protein